MIVDTSAVVAILRGEEDSKLYTDAIEEAIVCRISAGSLLETGIVIERSRNPILRRKLDVLLKDADFVIEPVTEEQVKIARDAYRDFGKGSGHAAGLNFGDCFAYALAKDTGEALLFKGDDFSETDIRSALTR